MPSNIQQNTDAQLTTATVTWTPPTTSDNSGGNVVLTSSHSPGHVFNIGTFTVTYTATDPYSNEATASFTVTVKGQSRSVYQERNLKDNGVFSKPISVIPEFGFIGME